MMMMLLLRQASHLSLALRKSWISSVEGHSGIKEINERLHLRIEEEYHQTPHRGIDNQTPLDKWCQAADKLRIAGPLDEIDDKFLFEAERKVATDSTVSLHTRTYEVASVLVGKTVTLRYDPTAPQRPIKVTHEGKDFGTGHLVDPVGNARTKRAAAKSKIKFASQPEEKDQ